MSFSAGAGRLDTGAHELGHNLGLDVGIGAMNGHSPFPNYWMASGSNRFQPNSLADICPAGACCDLLPQAEIDLARSSRLQVDYAADHQVRGPRGLTLVAVALAGGAVLAPLQRAASALQMTLRR
jgi:hypothetical protein